MRKNILKKEKISWGLECWHCEPKKTLGKSIPTPTLPIQGIAGCWLEWDTVVLVFLALLLGTWSLVGYHCIIVPIWQVRTLRQWGGDCLLWACSLAPVSGVACPPHFVLHLQPELVDFSSDANFTVPSSASADAKLAFPPPPEND